MAYFDCCKYMQENRVHILFMQWALNCVCTVCRSLFQKIFCNRLCYTQIQRESNLNGASGLRGRLKLSFTNVLFSPSPTPTHFAHCGIAKYEFKRVCETHMGTIWLLHTNTTNLQLTIHLLATEIKTQNTRLKRFRSWKSSKRNLQCLYWEFCNVALYMSSEHNCEKKDWMNSMTRWNHNEIKLKTRKFRCTSGGGGR